MLQRHEAVGGHRLLVPEPRGGELGRRGHVGHIERDGSLSDVHGVSRHKLCTTYNVTRYSGRGGCRCPDLSSTCCGATAPGRRPAAAADRAPAAPLTTSSGAPPSSPTTAGSPPSRCAPSPTRWA